VAQRDGCVVERHVIRRLRGWPVVPFVTLASTSVFRKTDSEGTALSKCAGPNQQVTVQNPELLIDAVVQQTMVFIAQLATHGGIRAPLAHVANQVFADLTLELERQGVRKKVIADMFGMALRTYHRRCQELRHSKTDSGTTLWEAIYGFVRERERVRAYEVHQRFRYDDADMVTGVLSDLVSTGLVYRAGRGEDATFRVVDAADLVNDSRVRSQASVYLVWLSVYRNRALTVEALSELMKLPVDACQAALDELVGEGRVRQVRQGEDVRYESDVLDVPLGALQGWEAAVLDHFQAMIAAITRKLMAGRSSSRHSDQVGGSTWSIDVFPGHPLEAEVKGTLARVRTEVESLRTRVDAHNAAVGKHEGLERVVVYVGQYVASEHEASWLDSSAGGETMDHG
jgi:hypothetical protein